MDYLDDAMRNMVERESRGATGGGGAAEAENRVQIGRVAHFFDKINVAAIELTGNLRVGDTIEIDSGEEEPLRQKVASMQINKKDIEEASKGDDVGIKLDRKVRAGSSVYRIG